MRADVTTSKNTSWQYHKLLKKTLGKNGGGGFLNISDVCLKIKYISKLILIIITQRGSKI